MLGPLLFSIIFINDIVNIDDSVNYIIYVDDTSLFVSGTKEDELINLANAVLCRAKSMSCVLTKSLTLNGTKMELSASAKTLGVIFMT